MIHIGDFFAIGLVVVLGMFYLEGRESKTFLTKSNLVFVICLLMTAVTGLMDIICIESLGRQGVPLWLNMALNTVYFIVNIITTSCIALFLFIKILEHAYDDHCMQNGCKGLVVLFAVFLVFVVANIWNQWIFYFDDQGNYYRGPLNAIGYVVTLLQMVLVVICYVRNRRNASKPMRRALVQTFPVVVVCIVIQRIFPEVMLNCFIMSMVDTVLFLSFQGQRFGVHSLTRLNDRHRFFKDIATRMHNKEKTQVLLINLKNYGAINQKYGHMHGDEILYQFAFALEKLIKNGTAFHMNGTVFALAVPYTSQSAAEENCGIVLNFLEEGIICNKEQIKTDYVLVEYISDENETDAESFYEKLEYAAAIAHKEKHHYIRYIPDMGNDMNRTRYLIDRLQNIDCVHGYNVWYQPIRCLETGEFCSMEALIRLYEPDGSIVSPAEFIPVAEQTGMISSITWFVLEEVCRFLSENSVLNGISVSINLPMSQLLERGFVERFNGIIDMYKIEHRRICLEFTERNILENFERTKEIMRELTRDGYRFYLDDFGTGYSNFNCLLQLPFQLIKLDASLTSKRNGNHPSYSLVRRLTSIFHDMELSVIAEGAETLEEVEILRKQGVDRVQGYAYAKPMPIDRLLQFYAENPVK